MSSPDLSSLALIATDNRLLGWSMTDLTLYGAQPVPGMVVGRASDATVPAPTVEAPAAPSDPAALAPALHDVAGDETALLVGGGHDGGGSGISSAPVVLPHAPAAVAFAPAVAQPVGAGSFIQPPVATPLPIVEAHDDHLLSAPDVQPLPAIQSPPDVAPVPEAAQVLAAVAPVLDAAHDLLAPAVVPAASITTPLTDLVGHAVDTVAPTNLLDHALDAAAPATGLVGTTLDAVGHAVEAIDHGPLDGFGGADPAAGIATLVGMVDSADAFDVGHAAMVTVTEPAGSILDALASDAFPSSLLGDTHDDAHHDAGHLVDDHGLHLGL